MSLAASLAASLPPLPPLEQFIIGFLVAPWLLGNWIVERASIGWHWFADGLSAHSVKALRRMLDNSEPELWIEYASSGALMLTALWFAWGQGARHELDSIMPRAVWIAWAAVVGVAQGASAACQDWRMRAVSDALAGLYWGITSVLLLQGGFTALHPQGFIFTGACALIVLRYVQRSERHGIT